MKGKESVWREGELEGDRSWGPDGDSGWTQGRIKVAGIRSSGRMRSWVQVAVGGRGRGCGCRRE